MNETKEILILGVGNEILMDDGIGPHLAKKIATMYNRDDIFADTACLGGLEILEYIRGYKTVIFIDAIKTLNGIPGTVYYFEPKDFRETLHLSSVHDVSFLQALELAKQTGTPIPEKIHIIAIEIVEDMTFGEEFTAPIQRRYEEILQKTHELVGDILKNG
jgi:hydrogenase maturation protease